MTGNKSGVWQAIILNFLSLIVKGMLEKGFTVSISFSVFNGYLLSPLQLKRTLFHVLINLF